MKKLVLLLIILIAFKLHAQPIPIFPNVSRAHDGMRDGKAIIYGNFIFAWRWGHDANIFVVVQDSATGQHYNLKVRLDGSGTKNYNPFCIYMKPGTYYIMNVGRGAPPEEDDLHRLEPLFKNAKRGEIITQGRADSLNADKYRFKITLAANTLYYTGTWDFKHDIIFRNDREALDHRLKHGLLKYDKLNFDKAVVELPE